jgi:hypothetical protein
MTTKTMERTLGDVLKHEYNPNTCREVLTLLTGTSYLVGHVLGKITASGKYTLCNPAAADGSQTAAAVVLFDTDASGGDKTSPLLVRGPAILAKNQLRFHANVDTQPEKDAIYASLKALGIIVQDDV